MRAILRVSGREDALAADKLLAARGVRVVATDRVDGVDLLVVDEWTPETAAHVQAARQAGIATTVLAGLLLDRVEGPVVGVTGTAGKTSTCRALADLLAACGLDVAISSTARSGNAWPDHSLLPGASPGAVTVAELTSTHLCHMERVQVDVGVVTLVRPDHLELHGGYEPYVAAKRRLVDGTPAGALVLPVDDPETLAALGLSGPDGWAFGAAGSSMMPGAFLDGSAIRLIDSTGRALPPVSMPAAGSAGRALLAACAAAMALGCAPSAVAAAIDRPRPLAHRMYVREIDRGVRLIDNTMAATPLKAVAALGELPAPPDVIVVGGDDELPGDPVHSSPEEEAAMADALTALRQATPQLIAFGPAAARIQRHVQPDQSVPDIETALARGVDQCPDRGVILVSPMFPMTPADRGRVAGPAAGT